MKVERIEPLVLNVSEKTNWFFMRVTADNGMTGIGEASLNGWETAQMAHAADFGAELVGKSVEEIVPLLRVFPHSSGGLIASSVVSAIEQAVTDLRAKQAGAPVYALLGKEARKAVRVYANINRGARDRSPAGIAKAAHNAVVAGFTAVKIAPFDGAYWGIPIKKHSNVERNSVSIVCTPSVKQSARTLTSWSIATGGLTSLRRCSSCVI